MRRSVVSPLWSVLVSMVAAWVFGRVIDKRKGDVLLVFGTVVNSILHVFRPFVERLRR